MYLEKNLDKLKQLAKSFQAQNERLNLSSFSDLESIWNKNILDSLLITNYLDADFESLIDIGTGGGFPLLPLAVCFPKAKLFGVDSVNKKLLAIEQLCKELDIKNVEALHARVEELAFDQDFREKFDVVTSRAFAKFPINLELCIGFIKIGGRFVAMLGPSSKMDIEKYKDLIETLGCEIEKFECVESNNGERCFLVLKKIKELDAKLPRSPKKLKRIYGL